MQAAVIALLLVVNEIVFHPVMRAERLFVSLTRRRARSVGA